MAGPVTEAMVMSWLSLQESDDNLVSVVAATNSFIVDHFGDISNGGVVAWPDRFISGGVALAARWYRRRNTPGGVETYGELGPVYVTRNDGDIAMMLGLGNYMKPKVG